MDVLHERFRMQCSRAQILCHSRASHLHMACRADGTRVAQFTGECDKERLALAHPYVSQGEHP